VIKSDSGRILVAKIWLNQCSEILHRGRDRFQDKRCHGSAVMNRRILQAKLRGDAPNSLAASANQRNG
jgi:hypothetical protein